MPLPRKRFGRAVPFFTESFALKDRNGEDLGRLLAAVGLKIAHELAHDHAKSALLDRLEGRLAAVLVNPGVEHRGSGAVAREFLDKLLRLSATTRPGKLAFSGENPFPEPRQKFFFRSGNRPVLRHMGMQINEPGEHNDSVGMQPAHALGTRFAHQIIVIADFCDQSVFDDNRPVADGAQLSVLRGIQKVATNANRSDHGRDAQSRPGFWPQKNDPGKRQQKTTNP